MFSMSLKKQSRISKLIKKSSNFVIKINNYTKVKTMNGQSTYDLIKHIIGHTHKEVPWLHSSWWLCTVALGVWVFFLSAAHHDLLFWWPDPPKSGFDRADFTDHNVKGLDMSLKHSWFIIKIDLETRK